MIMVILYGIVLWRYRNLVPLMWALMIVEVAFRLVSGSIHPLTEEYYLRTPPGKLGQLPLLVVSGLTLWLSVRNSRAQQGPRVGHSPVAT